MLIEAREAKKMSEYMPETVKEEISNKIKEKETRLETGIDLKRFFKTIKKNNQPKTISWSKRIDLLESALDVSIIEFISFKDKIGKADAI